MVLRVSWGEIPPKSGSPKCLKKLLMMKEKRKLKRMSLKLRKRWKRRVKKANICFARHYSTHPGKRDYMRGNCARACHKYTLYIH